jgi:hypothetical protein
MKSSQVKPNCSKDTCSNRATALVSGNSRKNPNTIVSVLPKIFIQNLLIFIRNYLIEIPFHKHEYEADPIHGFEMKMARKSWRNFLSAQNSEEWRRIRKETMLWELNRFYSTQYFQDENFRTLIKGKLADRYHQLCLIMTKGDRWDAQLVSGVHRLHIHSLKRLSIPPIHHVHHVIFSNCPRVGDILYLSDIHRLDLINLPGLYSIGPVLQTLQKLTLIGCPNAKAVQLPAVPTLSPRSLEYLNTDHFFFKQFTINDFKNLETLLIQRAIGRGTLDESVPPLQLPKLLRLDSKMSLQDVRGLPRLRSLRGKVLIEEEMPPPQDLLELLSQLEELEWHGLINDILGSIPNCRGLSFPYSSDDEFPILTRSEEYQRISDLDIRGDSRHVLFMDQFPIGGKMKSLNLAQRELIRSIKVLVNKKTGPRSFHRLDLCQTSLSDVSNLSNVTQVILDACGSLQDISPLRNVPYLDISYCLRITDFTSLGKQKFLKASGLHQLQDKDIVTFGDIQYLDIICCEKITDVSPLRNNFYLYLDGCWRLKTLTFHGSNYIQIVASPPENKESVIDVYGSIYSLVLDGFKPRIQGYERIEHLSYRKSIL